MIVKIPAPVLTMALVILSTVRASAPKDIMENNVRPNVRVVIMDKIAPRFVAVLIMQDAIMSLGNVNARLAGRDHCT